MGEPVPEHVVTQGECLSSLAHQYGFNWSRLWNDPANRALRALRRDPNVLFPGDIVVVPEKELKHEPRPTDQRHRFRVDGEPVKLRIRVLAAGKAVANEQYRLDIDGRMLQGTTDGKGMLEQVIPPDAEQATLLIGKEKSKIVLEIGHLDPLSEATGVQARLNNLGFHCGAVDGVVGPLTRSALVAFQETYNLQQTGQPDTATRDKLKELYGC